MKANQQTALMAIVASVLFGLAAVSTTGPESFALMTLSILAFTLFVGTVEIRKRG